MTTMHDFQEIFLNHFMKMINKTFYYSEYFKLSSNLNYESMLPPNKNSPYRNILNLLTELWINFAFWLCKLFSMINIFTFKYV